MFYLLSQWAADGDSMLGPLRLFRYVTFRAGGAAFSAFVLMLVFGPFMVRVLKHLQAVAPNRLDGLVADDQASKDRKRDVPSMGGILILGATVVAILLWAQPDNSLVLIFLGVLVTLGLVGFADDYLKVIKRSRDGLPGRTKLVAQVAIAVLAVWALDSLPETQDYMRRLYLPFVKRPLLLGLPLIVALAFGALVVVAASNAVNLSDGMDGLATGCTVICALTYAVFAYVTGHYNFARYLDVPFIRTSSEVVVIATAMAGAGLGFLWWNAHPASMFMGDTGSLALGGAIGLIAVLVKQELLLVLVGGIFVVEAGSVMLQVACYKATRRLTGTPRRLFRCAPIHHHFKLNGWPETQIVVRFWIVAVVLAAIGLATLKIR